MGIWGDRPDSNRAYPASQAGNISRYAYDHHENAPRLVAAGSMFSCYGVASSWSGAATPLAGKGQISGWSPDLSGHQTFFSPRLQGRGRGGSASVASHPRLATRGTVSIRNRSDGHRRGTAFLKRKCWRVLRLWNSGVLANAVSAPSKFDRKPPSSSAAPTPGPSLAGTGEKEVRDAVERCTADQRAHRNPGWPTPLA